MLETPFFKVEKYKEGESLGLAAVAGVFVAISLIAGVMASSNRGQVNLLEEQPAQTEGSTAKPSLNKEGKPIRTIML